MKKIFLFVAALVTSMVAKAWQVGDLYANDPTGVPAIVVYVDESGEHGLMMAPSAYTDKTYENFCKTLNKNRSKFEKRAAKISTIDKREEQFNMVWEWLKTAPRYDSETRINRKSPVYQEVAKLNTDFGSDNQKAIVKYCQDNNLELGEYFLDTKWASQLGDGWFIPGNHELELFCISFGLGLGDANGIKWALWLENHNAWLDKLGLLSLPSLYNNWVDPNAMFPDYNLHSSTLQPNRVVEYYRLNLTAKGGKAVWYLYYGTDEPAAIVAFKYF